MSLQSAKELIAINKHNRRIQKADELGKEYTKQLNEYLDAYFSHFEKNTLQENEFAFKTLNKEWKATCYKVNKLKNYSDIGFELKHNSFEVATADIISKNPEFQK